MKARRRTQSLSRRWFINTIGVVFVVLAVSIVTLSLMVQSSTYSGIEQALTGRVDELLNWLSGSSRSPSEFTAITRDYIESFPDKNEMEIMALNRLGKVFTTSTGFAPDENQEMPDYQEALQSGDDSGKWVGRLNSGERVMAITRVVRDEHGTLTGSVRYLVSLEKADAQTSRIVGILILAGLFIMLLIVFSGVYFVRSILVPVKQVNNGAAQIAKGDFDVRIEKARNDELGQLCDSINDMAGELAANERMKNDFISSVSHELRTPLTAIQGWAETLQQGADAETAEKGMTVITREAERLSGLVEELLDFSRLQSGRMRLHITRVELLTELDQAVFLFTDRAGSEKKELVYEEEDALPPVYGDGDRLRQVFVSLLDNALKYTEEGGTITVASQLKDGWVRVIVTDTGCGIPAEDLPHVKKKFYKANQLARGSGIGLAVADEIVAMHGGRLDIESKVGQGTRVTVSLPECAVMEHHPDRIPSQEIQKAVEERLALEKLLAAGTRKEKSPPKNGESR